MNLTYDHGFGALVVKVEVSKVFLVFHLLVECLASCLLRYPSPLVGNIYVPKQTDVNSRKLVGILLLAGTHTPSCGSLHHYSLSKRTACTSLKQAVSVASQRGRRGVSSYIHIFIYDKSLHFLLLRMPP